MELFTSANDGARSDRPIEVTTPGNFHKIHRMILSDRKLKLLRVYCVFQKLVPFSFSFEGLIDSYSTHIHRTPNFAIYISMFSVFNFEKSFLLISCNVSHLPFEFDLVFFPCGGSTLFSVGKLAHTQ